MADVTIEGSAGGTLDHTAGRGGVFWKSTTAGYIVYYDANSDLVYRKTTDGGATWAAAVVLITGTIMYFDCWADWQTAGDAGTKIHIVAADDDTDDVLYKYLETSDDTAGDTVSVYACPGDLVNTGATYQLVSITKTRGGNLAIALHVYDFTDDYLFYTSSDGTTWTSKNTPWEAAADFVQLYPGNEADTNDIWAVFWDWSADEVSLKTFDDSGNSWSEQSIASSMVEGTNYTGQDGQIRLSDGHLILAAWSEYDSATADLRVWDINGAASITEKTNVITNEAESIRTSVFINQVNNDIYIAYFSGTAALSLVSCFYKKSTDGGANWGGETAMQEGAEDDERWVSAGCMKASLGGKFQPVWFNDDLNDIYTNTTNGVSIEASGGGGWTHIAKVNGVAEASLAKVNGVAKASIAKISGVAV